MKIRVGVSNRHIHLCKMDADILFGENYEFKKRNDLSQTGEFACEEVVKVSTDNYEFPYVRVLGPLRNYTQVEVSLSDSKLLEYKGKAKSDKDRVSIEVKITADSIPSDDVSDDLKEKIKDLKKRINDIKVYIGSWYRSEMMKSLEKAHIPFLKPPLKKTNILLKNPNFKIATLLWEYIRNYEEEDSSRDNQNNNGTDAMLGFLNHGFLLNYAVMDSIFTSKREQKKQLSKYAVVLLSLEMKRIIELLRSQGIKIDDEELLRMLANEVNEEKNDRLAGSDDIKKKFKKAMDDYLERAQEYL